MGPVVVLNNQTSSLHGRIYSREMNFPPQAGRRNTPSRKRTSPVKLDGIKVANGADWS